MVDFSSMMQEAFDRKYPLYIIGFKKHRQRIEETFKNFGKAGSLFQKYKRKYKSAYMRMLRPPGVLMREAFNTPNVLLDKLKGNDEFVGKAITVPIEFKR